MANTIGSRIRKARCGRYLTQTQLAAKVGSSTSRVSNWERGVETPGAAKIVALCEALGCSSDFLLGLTEWTL